MDEVFGQRLKGILSILLIIVMAALLVNKVVYTHIHILPDGSVIDHAHPYSKSTENKPGATHQHSNMILFLLDQMDVLILCATAAFVKKQFAPFSSFREPVSDRLLPAFVVPSHGRAPPVCI